MQKTVIEANGKNLQYWKDLWRYRELAVNLAKRDFTVRYKQTAIGFGWSIINPIINMFLMTFIFGNLAGFSENSEIPYYVVTYSGLLPWTLFSRSFTLAASTFVTNADLMRKVYFPRLLAPVSSTMTSLIDTAISFVLLFLLMLVFGYTPPVRMLLAPLMLIPVMLLGTFAGLFVASFTVKYRDLIQLVPLLMQIGQYATPVAYSLDDISEKIPAFARYLFLLNPATGVVSAFKWCTLSTESFPLTSVLISLAWLAVIIPLAMHRFRKTERTFVDIV